MFKKHYSFINLKVKTVMPDIERKDLFKNMKALLLHRVSAFIVLGGSSLIITRLVSLRDSGIYNNYYLITYALHTVTNEVFNGILASFGNLLNTESKDKVYANFNVIYLLNFFIYSFVTASFFNIVTPFIGLWIGEGTVFSTAVTVSIACYVYMYGMKQSITMAKMSAGIYDADKYAALVGVAISIAASLILVKPLGIAGVMIGNVIGIIAVPQWVQPKLVYNTVFRRDSKIYHYKYILYTALTLFYTYLSYIICSQFKMRSGILQVAVNFGVCLVIPNLINILLFCKTKEFKNLLLAAKSFLKNIKGVKATF